MKVGIRTTTATLTFICALSLALPEPIMRTEETTNENRRYDFWASLFGYAKTTEETPLPIQESRHNLPTENVAGEGDLYQLHYTPQGPCFQVVTTSTTPATKYPCPHLNHPTSNELLRNPNEPGQALIGSQLGQVPIRNPSELNPEEVPGSGTSPQLAQILPGQEVPQILPGQNPDKTFSRNPVLSAPELFPEQNFPVELGQQISNPGQTIPGPSAEAMFPGQSFLQQPESFLPGLTEQIIPGPPPGLQSNQPGPLQFEQINPVQPGEVFPFQQDEIIPGPPPGLKTNQILNQPGETSPFFGGFPNQLFPAEQPLSEEQLLPGQQSSPFGPGKQSNQLIPAERPSQIGSGEFPNQIGPVQQTLPLPGTKPAQFMPGEQPTVIIPGKQSIPVEQSNQIFPVKQPSEIFSGEQQNEILPGEYPSGVFPGQQPNEFLPGTQTNGKPFGENPSGNLPPQITGIFPEAQPNGVLPGKNPTGILPKKQPSEIFPAEQPNRNFAGEKPNGIFPEQPSGIFSGENPGGVFLGENSNGISPQQHSGIYPGGQSSEVLSGEQPTGLFPGDQTSGILPEVNPSGIFPSEQPSGFLPGEQPFGIFPGEQQSGIFPEEQPSGIHFGEQPNRVVPGGQPNRVVHGENPSGVFPAKQPSGIFSGEQPNKISPGQQPNGLSSVQQPNGIFAGQQPNGIPSPQQPNGIFPGQQPNGIPPVQQPNGISPGQQPNGISSPQQPNGIFPGQQPNGIFTGQQPNGIPSPQQPNGIFPGQQPNGIPSPQQTNGIFPGQQPNGIPPGQQPNRISPGQQPNGIFPGQQPNGIFPGQQPNGNFPGQQPNGISPGQQPNGIFPGQQPNGFFPGEQPNEIFPGEQPSEFLPGQQPNQLLPGGSPSEFFPSQTNPNQLSSLEEQINPAGPNAPWKVSNQNSGVLPGASIAGQLPIVSIPTDQTASWPLQTGQLFSPQSPFGNLPIESLQHDQPPPEGQPELLLPSNPDNMIPDSEISVSDMEPIENTIQPEGDQNPENIPSTEFLPSLFPQNLPNVASTEFLPTLPPQAQENSPGQTFPAGFVPGSGDMNFVPTDQDHNFSPFQPSETSSPLSGQQLVQSPEPESPNLPQFLQKQGGPFPIPSNPPTNLPSIPGSGNPPKLPQPPQQGFPSSPETNTQFPGQSQFPSIPPPELPDESVIETIPQPGLPGELSGFPTLPGAQLSSYIPTQLSGPNENSNCQAFDQCCQNACSCCPNNVPPLSDQPEIRGVETCAGLAPGPFVPPGFYPVDNELQQQRNADQCGLTPVTQIECSMPQVFEQLRLRVIYNLIMDAGLELLFTETNNYTFFAPVDTAFDLLPIWFMQSLKMDKNLLKAFITNHYVKIPLPLDTLGSEFLIMNFRGSRIRINVYNQDTDYRIYTVDGARILQSGIQTTTGTLHIVDKVIMPIPKRNFAQYLAEVPDFSNFLQAVTDSGLLPTLDDTIPYTIFIPYNLAFRSIDYSAISSNLNSLRNFVKHHIVNGTHNSAGLLHGQFLLTNYYKEIKISISSDSYTKFADSVNGRIRIIKSDIPVLNGVGHVISDCITSDPNFFNYEELSEFSSEFGAFRRATNLYSEEFENDFS